VLFDSWKVSSVGGLVGSMIGIFIMAALYEGLKYYRCGISVVCVSLLQSCVSCVGVSLQSCVSCVCVSLQSCVSCVCPYYSPEHCNVLHNTQRPTHNTQLSTNSWYLITVSSKSLSDCTQCSWILVTTNVQMFGAVSANSSACWSLQARQSHKCNCSREYLFWKTYNSLQYRAVSIPADKAVGMEDRRIAQ
jgi:hypothetical protein